MIVLKVYLFIILLFNIYLMFQSKKKNINDILFIKNKLEKIDNFKRFKNTKDIRTKYIWNIRRIIFRKHLFIGLYLVLLCVSFVLSAVVSLIYFGTFIGTMLGIWSILIAVNDFKFKPWKKIDWKDFFSIRYRIMKIIEIIILLVLILC